MHFKGTTVNFFLKEDMHMNVHDIIQMLVVVRAC